MTIKLRASGWELGGKHLPWLWGGIQYWDLERSRWRDVLRSTRELGQAVISTAVLPRVHQVEPGQYDFGALRPQNDLPAFLTEAGQAGLKVVLWAGPRDLPGVAAAGYPDELLLDSSALARASDGSFLVSQPGFGGEVFALPSLASSQLRRVLEPFARELAAWLAPFVHPDGPVIGIGLTQAPGWLPGLPAFAADYHPEALERYREFLKKKYKKIQALAQAYGSPVTAFEEVEPPRAPAKPGVFPGPYFQDWAEFKEDYFVRAAETLHSLFSPLAFDRVPLLLAALPASERPANLAELERSRCFDYIMPEAPVRSVEEETEFFFSLAGQISPLCWLKARPEPADPEENSESGRLLGGIAAGLRGWDALSPSGAGAHPGFLTDRQGSPIHDNSFWETLRELTRSEGLLDGRVYGDIYLVTVPEFERAVYLQTPPAPRYDLFGAGLMPANAKPVFDPATADYVGRRDQLEQFLIREQYAYLKVPGDASLDAFQSARLLIVPGSSGLSPGLQARLAEILEKEVDVLIAGPMPVHPDGAKHTPLAELAKAKTSKSRAGKGPKLGKLHHLPEPADARLIRTLQQIGIVRELTLDHAGLRLTFHRFRNRIFVAAANPESLPVETLARREDKFVLKDFWGNKRFLGGNREIRVVIPPRSIKFWELIPC